MKMKDAREVMGQFDGNVELTKEQYEFIITLPKFDLEMLLSDIHEHGWPVAENTLVSMHMAAVSNPKEFYQ